jgi:hypothetical protein
MQSIATDPAEADGSEVRFPDKLSPVIWGICSPRTGIAAVKLTAINKMRGTRVLRISELWLMRAIRYSIALAF